MYEWIDINDSNLTPDAEVIVWNLLPSATLPNGALEFEFDNWCAYNNEDTAPLVPPSAPPSFTWNGILYEYLTGCGSIDGNGNYTNTFYGDDLLLDPNSSQIIGYVVNSSDNTNNTIVAGSTARGWQAISTPAGLTATPGSGSVTLSWTAATGATSYNIYQGSSAGNEGASPVDTGVTTNSAVISGLTSGQTYYLRLRRCTRPALIPVAPLPRSRSSAMRRSWPRPRCWSRQRR
jgi:hypothetical protein